MKVNKLAVLVALAVSASAAHAVVAKPKLVLEQKDKEVVEFCKLFPDASICKQDTDGAGNGGGKRPPE